MRRTSMPTASSREDEERQLYRHYGSTRRGPRQRRDSRDGPASDARRGERRGTRPRLGSDDRRRDDALGGGVARRHDAHARPAACACASTS